MQKSRVLFVCIHNSARSQMAEALLNAACPARFEAHSAGFEPGMMNPLVVEAMAEVGIDLSQKGTQSVFELSRQGRLYSHVITVCDAASDERCPIFVGVTQRLQWSFPDPSALAGTHAERLRGVRAIRDAIRARVEAWCAEMCASAA